MSKIPTWEEMEASGKWDNYGSMAREFARMHSEAALKAASERKSHGMLVIPLFNDVQKESILSAYPLTNII